MDFITAETPRRREEFGFLCVPAPLRLVETQAGRFLLLAATWDKIMIKFREERL